MTASSPRRAPSPDSLAVARRAALSQLSYTTSRDTNIAARLRGEYLFGRECSVADAYLYVMLRWARMQELEAPAPLPAFFERMEARPAVRLALQHEGLA